VDIEVYHKLARTIICLAARSFICRPEKKDDNIQKCMYAGISLVVVCNQSKNDSPLHLLQNISLYILGLNPEAIQQTKQDL
jgi:hypothetical protein